VFLVLLLDRCGMLGWHKWFTHNLQQGPWADLESMVETYISFQESVNGDLP
jgi:hypothetical protein